MNIDPTVTLILAVALLGLAAMAKHIKITLKGLGVKYFTIEIKR